MAPSSTIGAVMPQVRRAPTKVVVFQWPCGTGARQRSPRGERPQRRAIFVDVPVSSMNTRRSGSSSGWSSSQARRRRRTSGRCCSLACAVFFEGHAVTIEQPPHGALRHLHPVLPLQATGRAHVLTPVTNAHLVCRLLLEKKNNKQTEDSYTNNIKKRY